MRRILIRLTKIAAGIVLSVLAAVVLLLFTMWWEHRSPIALPTPTGSFAVSRTQFAWTNAISHDELAAWIWYPAARTNQSAADYLPAAWRNAVRDRQGTLMRSFFKRAPVVVRTHSRSDAPMASHQRTYPLGLLRPG